MDGSDSLESAVEESLPTSPEPVKRALGEGFREEVKEVEMPRSPTLWQRLFGVIMRRSMQEDRSKVQRYITWLNDQTPGQNWVDLTGYNALTTCYYTATGRLIFNPQFGTPIKAFLNQATGEIRSFDARFFHAQG